MHSAANFALSTANVYASAQPGEAFTALSTLRLPTPKPPTPASPKTLVRRTTHWLANPLAGWSFLPEGWLSNTPQGKLVGGLGVSGRHRLRGPRHRLEVRHAIAMDGVPMGVGTDQTDNIIFDIQNGTSASGFGHPSCKGGRPSDDIAKKLPQTHPVRRK